MSNRNGAAVTHVFYAFLKFRNNILADEKDKKQFLDFALESQEEYGICILAFVVLDSEMHFLVQETKTRKRGLAVRKMLKGFEKFQDRKEQAYTDCSNTESSCREILSMEEIKQVCRMIHRIPLKKGFVTRIRDYWWSSYQTYRGGYRWKGLDTTVLFDCFSEDSEKNRRMFLEYHRGES